MKKTTIPKKEIEEIYVEVEPDEPKEKAESGKPKHNSDLRNTIIFLIVILVITASAYLIYLKIFLPLKNPKTPETVVTDNYTYKNYEFKKINSLWTTDVQVGSRLITIWLHNGAREVWPIEIIGYLNTSFDEGPVYITFDPRDENREQIALAAGELGLNIVNGIDREVIGACARNETEACIDRLIVTCDSEDKSVIYLQNANTTWVQFENNCIIVRGNGPELLKATDKLILYWYGIVPKEGKLLNSDAVQVTRGTNPKQ